MKLSRLRTRSSAVMLVTAATMSACGSGSEPDTAGSLTIADQGSFTVGGTTTTAPGQFDPLQPLKPEVRRITVIMPTPSTKYRRTPVGYRSYWCTAPDNSRKHESQPPTDAKAFRAYSCAVTTVRILSVNHLEAMPAEAQSARQSPPLPMNNIYSTFSAR